MEKFPTPKQEPQNRHEKINTDNLFAKLTNLPEDEIYTEVAKMVNSGHIESLTHAQQKIIFSKVAHSMHVEKLLGEKLNIAASDFAFKFIRRRDVPYNPPNETSTEAFLETLSDLFYSSPRFARSVLMAITSSLRNQLDPILFIQLAADVITDPRIDPVTKEETAKTFSAEANKIGRAHV
jgi:hypothetical protein